MCTIQNYSPRYRLPHPRLAKYCNGTSSLINNPIKIFNTPKRFDDNDMMRVPEKGKDPARILA